MLGQIPTPRNWQDFEHLCWKLWKLIWNDPEAQKNGRSGDQQAGVDIFGRPDRGRSWAAVQCKGKDSYTRKKLTSSEVREEVDQAKKFRPALASCAIATSGPRDVKMQELAREITDAHRDQGLFTVAVFGWDDIVDLLGEHRDLLASYLKEIGYREGLIAAPSRLPNTGGLLVGREAELKRLDEAWDNPAAHILSLVAWGGMGKTALVKHWMGRMSADGWRGARRVFDWSFYSQGTSDKAASADLFVATALRWFGDPDPAAGTPWEKGERLARLVSKEPTLLVLDGLEPLQHPPGLGMQGQLKDPALATALKGLAASNPGLCVITTREPVSEIAHLEGSTGPRIDLGRLSAGAAARLLAQLGVKGTEGQRREASESFAGHALAVTLLGTWLAEVHEGDPRLWREVSLLKEDAEEGGHARRVMRSYGKWLAGGPEWPMLRLIGFFDRPAEAEALEALLAEPAVAGLTEELVALTPDKRRRTLSRLQSLRLLAESPGGGMDAHPLVREHMGEELEKLPEAAREGHRRLYEHYRGAAGEEFPGTLEGLTPLYRAVWHGCRGGLHQRAYEEVWRRRIHRGKEFFSSANLGAIGVELETTTAFFERSWDRPIVGLTPATGAFVLNEAGFLLRALGRLGEAADAIRAAIEATKAVEDWKSMARYAGNLSDLEATRGDLRKAEELGRRSLELADCCKDGFQRMSRRTTLAHTLWRRGRRELATALLEEAEAMQQERQPEYPLLYSGRGQRFCEVLLGEAEETHWSLWLRVSGRPPENLSIVSDRASRTLKWVTRKGWILDIAMDHLTLGRVGLLNLLAVIEAGTRASDEALSQKAAEHLEAAVAGLRQAGTLHHVPQGLIARACLRGVTGPRRGPWMTCAKPKKSPPGAP